jgi:hypothetical protein
MNLRGTNPAVIKTDDVVVSPARRTQRPRPSLARARTATTSSEEAATYAGDSSPLDVTTLMLSSRARLRMRPTLHLSPLIPRCSRRARGPPTARTDRRLRDRREPSDCGSLTAGLVATTGAPTSNSVFHTGVIPRRMVHAESASRKTMSSLVVRPMLLLGQGLMTWPAEHGLTRDPARGAPKGNWRHPRGLGSMGPAATRPAAVAAPMQLRDGYPSPPAASQCQRSLATVSHTVARAPLNPSPSVPILRMRLGVVTLFTSLLR